MKSNNKNELYIMQRCVTHFVSKIIRVPIIRQYNCHTNSTKNEITTQEQQDNGLISSEWEEAIIKEQRMPDISFDSMEKDTIAKIHNNSFKNKNLKRVRC